MMTTRSRMDTVGRSSRRSSAQNTAEFISTRQPSAGWMLEEGVGVILPHWKIAGRRMQNWMIHRLSGLISGRALDQAPDLGTLSRCSIDVFFELDPFSMFKSVYFSGGRSVGKLVERQVWYPQTVDGPFEEIVSEFSRRNSTSVLGCIDVDFAVELEKRSPKSTTCFQFRRSKKSNLLGSIATQFSR